MELRLAFLGSIFLTVAVVAVAYAQVPVDEAERPVIIPGNQRPNVVLVRGAGYRVGADRAPATQGEPRGRLARHRHE